MNQTERTDILSKRDRAHYAVHFANRRLAERSWGDECYVANRIALDALMLHLAKGKWHLGKALGTHSAFGAGEPEPQDLRVAGELFDYVEGRAFEIEAAIAHGNAAPPPGRPDFDPRSQGHEVLLVDGVPLPPTSAPVVVLQGSNEDMGRQYAQQIIQIYGGFILAWHGSREFDDAELAEIARWKRELAAYTPGVLAFAIGLAQGARLRGLPFSDEHAVAMFTGVRPPAKEARPFALAQSPIQQDSLTSAYLGFGEKNIPSETPSPCSGAMAWGDASVDGALVGASSTDHDCTFQATIVAYPERGNPFVWTPYSANGSIPVLGHFFFGGHPGLNSKGLAYVHHNGSTMGEPVEEWGYGVRRGPIVMHILQFCNTAKEALDFMLKLPVGDSGISQGTAGGMFADATYGFSLEARPGAPASPRPILREHTFDRDGQAYNFLYGTNNAIAPESGHLNAAPVSGKGYDYSLEGGWFSFDPELLNSGTAGESIKRRITKNSEGRNRFFHAQLTALAGSLDIETFASLYRTSGSIPPGSFKEICERYHRGEQWDCAPGHRANAFVVSFRAAPGEAPIYRACIGPLERTLNCRDPGHGYYYYDETNAYWELALTDTAEDLIQSARTCARYRLSRAEARLAELPENFAGLKVFARWLEAARQHLRDEQACWSAPLADQDERVSALSSALRHLHWVQVRAGQVLNAIDPPSHLPAHL